MTAKDYDENFDDAGLCRTPRIAVIMSQCHADDRRKTNTREVIAVNDGRSNAPLLGLITIADLIGSWKKVKDRIALLCESLSSNTT